MNGCKDLENVGQVEELLLMTEQMQDELDQKDQTILELNKQLSESLTLNLSLIHICFVWEDGVEYEISKVKDIRRAASLKAGGAGMRYTCVVDGKEVYLFYEDNNMWFMEKSA